MNDIDIVVTTCGRTDYLKRTLEHIWQRTHYPYHLTVIDDGTNGEHVDWLLKCYWAGRIDNLVLKGMKQGAMAALNAGLWMTYSDPVVFTDDDVLCPDVEPCWLERGVRAMERHPELAMLALRHPGAKVKAYEKSGNVTYCRSLGGTFLFCRRKFLIENPLPHDEGRLDRPMEPRCKAAHEKGWKIGVLWDTYCYHIGEVSALTGERYKGKFVAVKDWQTLEPVE